MEKNKNSSIILKEKPKKRRNQSQHSVMEKCQAVLSIWSDRRKASHVCQELGINWAILSQWQNRALEGMMQALTPRMNLQMCSAINPRLQALLEKKAQQIRKRQQISTTEKLNERLKEVSETAEIAEKGAYMSQEELEAQARKRATVILRVRSGQITAAEGARELGISRKSYYEWEKKALKALVETLQDRPTGRPAAQTDPEQERQEQHIRQLEQENELLRARLELQDLIMRMETDKKKPAQKKPEKS